MSRSRFWFLFALHLVSCIVVSVIATSAHAALTLTTTAPDVVVYSGPGEHYRALTSLAEKVEIKASNQIVSSSAGRFYRVAIRLGPKIKAIGFIPITAAVQVGAEVEDTDDLTKYGAVALISRAVQITYSAHKNQQNAWTLGYMHYLSPGFYVKGFAGQWATALSNATTIGGEIGNDALLVGSISGFVSYGFGAFLPESDNAIFDGSSKLNAFMSASLGVRYNIEGFASIAIGVTQAVAYNQNNSMVSTGAIASLEVGL